MPVVTDLARLMHRDETVSMMLMLIVTVVTNNDDSDDDDDDTGEYQLVEHTAFHLHNRLRACLAGKS